MSIVSSREIAEGRTAGVKFENKRFVNTSARVFRVTTDTKHDGWYIINNASAASPNPVPALFSTDPTKTSLTAKGIDPRQEDVDGRSWLVTVTYDDDVIDQNNTDPISRAVRYRLEWNRVSKDMLIDQDGNLVLNTCADPFEDGVQTNESRPVLIAVKNYPANELSDIIALAIDYQDSVNTDTFHGATAGHVLCRSLVTGDLQSENNTDFYSVTHEFEFRSDDAITSALGAGAVEFERTPTPWDRIVLNRGFNVYATADTPNTKYPLPNKEAQKIKQDGTLWGFGSPSEIGGFYRVFREFKQRPFSVLGV